MVETIEPKTQTGSKSGPRSMLIPSIQAQRISEVEAAESQRIKTNIDELDRVLGQVLEAVDFDFNTLLELGFRTSIQKEWAWRVARGESLQNLQAFEHLIDDDKSDGTGDMSGAEPSR